MALIYLPHGIVAIVDDIDTEVTEYKWNGDIRDNTIYVWTKVGGHKVYLHQMIAKPPKGGRVDHIDGDGLNNRRENLRCCTQMQNCRNSRKHSHTSSKYKGVYFDSWARRWRASIKVNYTALKLGRFDNEDDAARAYNVAAVLHFGEFAKLNEVAE